MARAKPIKRTKDQPKKNAYWPIPEDWLATVAGLVIILVIRFGDVIVKWPLYGWFKK